MTSAISNLKPALVWITLLAVVGTARNAVFAIRSLSCFPSHSPCFFLPIFSTSKCWRVPKPQSLSLFLPTLHIHPKKSHLLLTPESHLCWQLSNVHINPAQPSQLQTHIQLPTQQPCFAGEGITESTCPKQSSRSFCFPMSHSYLHKWSSMLQGAQIECSWVISLLSLASPTPDTAACFISTIRIYPEFSHTVPPSQPPPGRTILTLPRLSAFWLVFISMLPPPPSIWSHSISLRWISSLLCANPQTTPVTDTVSNLSCLRSNHTGLPAVPGIRQGYSSLSSAPPLPPGFCSSHFFGEHFPEPTHHHSVSSLL